MYSNPNEHAYPLYTGEMMSVLFGIGEAVVDSTVNEKSLKEGVEAVKSVN